MRYVQVHNDEGLGRVTLIPVSRIDRVEINEDGYDRVISDGLVYIPEVNEKFVESLLNDKANDSEPQAVFKRVNVHWECSRCGGYFQDEITFMGEINYCPRCGKRLTIESK